MVANSWRVLLDVHIPPHIEGYDTEIHDPLQWADKLPQSRKRDKLKGCLGLLIGALLAAVGALAFLSSSRRESVVSGLWRRWRCNR